LDLVGQYGRARLRVDQPSRHGIHVSDLCDVAGQDTAEAVADRDLGGQRLVEPVGFPLHPL
jgi:hypothetical protein